MRIVRTKPVALARWMHEHVDRSHHGHEAARDPSVAQADTLQEALAEACQTNPTPKAARA